MVLLIIVLSGHMIHDEHLYQVAGDLWSLIKHDLSL